MKRHLICILASAAVAVTGCNETTETNAGGGQGTIRIACKADISIDAEAKASPKGTRAEITAPAGSEFALRITGAGFDRSWESVAAFDAEENVFVEGPYKIAVDYGDPEAEGTGKPYFSGTTDLDVVARRVNTAEITARIAKSQTLVRATEAFLKFYHDAEFTVTTGSGNEFTFRPDGSGDAERIWVEVGTTLTLKGTARGQSQDGEKEGPLYTFPAQTLDATVAATCHIFTLDASNAGSASLHIILGEGEGEIRPIDIELNEDAIPSK